MTTKGTIYPNLSYSICVEDLDIGHITYNLQEVKRWYPAPEKITHYTAALRFGVKQDDQVELQIPKVEDLDNLIQFLMELKLQWESANKSLVPNS